MIMLGGADDLLISWKCHHISRWLGALRLRAEQILMGINRESGKNASGATGEEKEIEEGS